MRENSGVYLSGNRIEGIVFDLDGTLIDSTDYYYEVFQEAIEQVGIPITRAQVLEPLALGREIWDVVIPRDIPDREEKIQQCKSIIPGIFVRVFKNVRPFPGLMSVLKKLEESALRLGVVTSSWKSAALPLFDHSLAPYFKTIITREDGFKLKPAPDGILECLRHMNVDPGRAITVGDTPMDIRAGKASGTLTIAVLSGIGTREQLEAENPTFIIKSATQILSVLSLN
jgi:HAD superfamily hydrolase (TIGR01509 family)